MSEVGLPDRSEPEAGAPRTLPVMADPDAQIVAGHSFAGWDIAEWCRWSISTSDDIEDDPTLYLVVSTRGESFIRTVTPEQMREMASYLTQLAEHVEDREAVTNG